MKTAPEQLALQHIRAVCQGHADALLVVRFIKDVTFNKRLNQTYSSAV
jgi:hypothetical protein